MGDSLRTLPRFQPSSLSWELGFPAGSSTAGTSTTFQRNPDPNSSWSLWILTSSLGLSRFQPAVALRCDSSELSVKAWEDTQPLPRSSGVYALGDNTSLKKVETHGEMPLAFCEAFFMHVLPSSSQVPRWRSSTRQQQVQLKTTPLADFSPFPASAHSLTSASWDPLYW